MIQIDEKSWFLNLVISDSPVTVVEQAVQTYDWGVSSKEIDVVPPVQVQTAPLETIETEKGRTMVSFTFSRIQEQLVNV